MVQGTALTRLPEDPPKGPIVNTFTHTRGGVSGPIPPSHKPQPEPSSLFVVAHSSPALGGSYGWPGLGISPINTWISKFKTTVIKIQESWLLWLSFMEHRPINQKVLGLILGQGTCLGCGLGLQ